MFENLIGNTKAKEILNNINKPTHAYMFLGKEGIGKLLFAKEFANKFLCISDNPPCYKCKSCIQLKSGNNTDFKIIDVVDNSIKVEQIREIISKIYEKPILCDKKIYIINNADKMTTQAQNCLLKILEEPPKYVIIILIVENEYAMLNTIKSRCLKMRFNQIEKDELKIYLEQKVGFENITDEMLEIYDGSISKALEIKGKEELYTKVQELIDSLENKSQIELIKMSKNIYENKEEVKNLLEYMNMFFYKKSFDNVKYINCIKKVNNTISKLRINCNNEMLVDTLLLEIYDELQE